MHGKMGFILVCGQPLIIAGMYIGVGRLFAAVLYRQTHWQLRYGVLHAIPPKTKNSQPPISTVSGRSAINACTSLTS
jgi:hypothetical protein